MARNHLLVAGAALLLPSILFLGFPAEIANANSAEIAFSPSDLLPFVWCFLAISAASYAVLIAFPGIAGAILATMAALSAAIITWNVVFSTLGPTDASWRPAGIAIELGSLAMAAVLFLRLPRTLMLRAACLFGLMNFAVTASQMATLLTTLTPRDVGAQVERDFPAPVSAQANVYHIVLDAFSEQFLESQLNKYADQLAGFTFYPRAFTHYGTTDLSMRAVFSGTLHGADLVEWGDAAFSNGLLKSLSDAGIQLTQYPFYNSFCSPDAIVCEATQDHFTNTRPGFESFSLIDLAFQKTMPPSVRSWMLTLGSEDSGRPGWELGFSVSSWIETLLKGEEPVWRRNIQAQTIQTVDDFIRTEPRLGDSGRYTYLHVMLPHDPHVFDPDCRFAPEGREAEKSQQQRIDDQFACAMFQLNRVLQTIKSLSRFDNALILVHGDHGSSYTWACPAWDKAQAFDESVLDADRHADETENWSDQQVRCIAQPLLLVKRPNSTMFKVSTELASLVDIASTILDHFGLSMQSDGSSLLIDNPRRWPVPTFFATQSGTLQQIQRFSRYEFDGLSWRFVGTTVNGAKTNQ
ncbi:sulfatase-like hydrolase/transferase [Devosia sp.]|uniref:sulfatase-like hydrolase/transferase n=1 Tax=Devosia sp. TaxID=1871048 RepID=UPI001B186FA6|nr:sulfatase-like hydrolase/transferase [Devosia sp.]MBO9591150.1 sulfatase-like hydrolase/transferase [Devosia sp.]